MTALIEKEINIAFSGKMASAMNSRLTDEGGGGRFEALRDITDMDYTVVNNRRHKKHSRRLSDSEIESSSASKFRREEENQTLIRNEDEKDQNKSPEAVSTNSFNYTNPTSAYNSENDTVEHLLIVELINNSVTAKLIEDRATLRHLLNSSLLGEKSTGIYRYQTLKNRIILHITDTKDIPDLLKTENLEDENENERWPIKCSRAQNNPGLSCLGVIKGIPTSVDPIRVKSNLIREGTNVIGTSRITRRYREETITTRCIKIEFYGHTKPDVVKYAGYDKKVHPYIPPIYTLLCHTRLYCIILHYIYSTNNRPCYTIVCGSSALCCNDYQIRTWNLFTR